MSEESLVKSAMAGDQVAFAGVVEIYQRPVYNLCYRMLGNSGEAEDAAQESFLRAYAQRRRYDPTRSFKTWLLSIASHYCIDRLRKRRVHYVSIDDEPLQVHPALREQRAGPEEAVLAQEQADRIQVLLAGLAPENRNALVMRYWYDLSYEEIAAVTGASVSAVKSRLHRARLTVGEMLQPEVASAGGRKDQRAATATHLAPSAVSPIPA